MDADRPVQRDPEPPAVARRPRAAPVRPGDRTGRSRGRTGLRVLVAGRAPRRGGVQPVVRAGADAGGAFPAHQPDPARALRGARAGPVQPPDPRRRARRDARPPQRRPGRARPDPLDDPGVAPVRHRAGRRSRPDAGSLRDGAADVDLRTVLPRERRLPRRRRRDRAETLAAAPSAAVAGGGERVLLRGGRAPRRRRAGHDDVGVAGARRPADRPVPGGGPRSVPTRSARSSTTRSASSRSCTARTPTRRRCATAPPRPRPGTP